MRFRWRRNSSPFIPFETGTTSLTLTNVQLSENGANYDVVATNRANSAPGRVSAKAFLTVLVDTDGDRAPDAWENSNGFSSTNPLDALQDADGDGASNLAEYEARAFRLAQDRAMLAEIRAQWASSRASCPLFDSDRFRRHLEAAYVMMWERFQRAEPPASFSVQALR